MQFHPLSAIRRQRNFVARRLQHLFKQRPHVRIVIYDKNPRHPDSSSGSKAASSSNAFEILLAPSSPSIRVAPGTLPADIRSAGTILEAEDACPVTVLMDAETCRETVEGCRSFGSLLAKTRNRQQFDGMRRAIFILLLPLLLPQADAQSTNQQSFRVKGLVVGMKPEDKKIEIKHDAIPGYMPAMTMQFGVKTTNELAGLEAGDSILFRLVVTETNGWVEQIRKIAAGGTNTLSTAGAVRPIRNIVPLSEGGLLPEYHFTNQLGQAFSTKQFEGQALAITFLFTRCPFPDFCPLMANNFSAAQKRLLAMHNAPANWQLLTISFDPQFDTPAVLKGYAESHNYDPAHWTFATGDLTDIAAIGGQFGLTFWHDETGSITHTLRTVVIDASGRVQKIFVNNTWTGDELVVEMLKAAKVKP